MADGLQTPNLDLKNPPPGKKGVLMLKSFRSLLEGGGRYVLAVVIILAFAVVGVPQLDNFGGSSAITVGSQDITALDIERELRSRVARIQQENPGVTREELIAAGLGQQVIEGMVAQSLLEHEAARLGMSAPDTVLQDYIQRIEGLTDPETGRFDQQTLALFLQQQGLSVSAFGDLVRGELLRTQLATAVGGVVAAPKDLTRALLLREFENRTVRYAVVPAADAIGTPSEESIEAAYNENLQQYLTPEYRTFTVVTVTPDDIAEEITISEDEVRQLFEARAGEASASETRSVRQLLVPAADAEAAAELARTGAGIDAIAEAIEGRVTMLSDQRRADFINQALGDAVFAAEEGALVGPVASDFGTVFAEVTGIERTEGPSFEEQRAELEASLREEVADRRVLELVEEIESARDFGTPLGEAAETVGLTPRRVGPVDRELFTEFGAIANIPPALGAEGFALVEGEESAAVRLPNGYGFVVAESVTAPRPKPLSEVRGEVVSELEEEARANAAATLKAEFEGLLAQGQDFETAASALGAEVATAVVSPRDEDMQLPNEVAAEIFGLLIGDLTAVTVPGDEPSVYIAEVVEVNYGNSAALDPVLPQVSQQFGQQVTRELSEAYLTALEQETTVKQKPSQIARALGVDQP